MALYVLEPALAEPQREGGGRGAAPLHRCLGFMDQRARLVRTAANLKVVDQACQVLTPDAVVQPGERERATTGIRTHVGRDAEHLRDREAYFCLLGRGQDLAQGGVGKRRGFLHAPCGVEGYGCQRNQWTAEWVMIGCELERAPPQLHSGGRVRSREGLCGLQKRGDGDLVAGLCAGRKLKRDLDRRRSGSQKHVDGLAVKRLGRGSGDGGADGLANEVVLEA